MLKPRIKRHGIWSMDINDFSEIVKRSGSIGEIIQTLGYKPSGGLYWAIRKRCEIEQIDMSHIPFGLGSNKGMNRSVGPSPRPLSEILIRNSQYTNTNKLKKRLIKDGFLKEICYICKLNPLWNKKVLVLQLDHENGKSNDNRISNLRLLCPNCHSQTQTFAGRNIKKKP